MAEVTSDPQQRLIIGLEACTKELSIETILPQRRIDLEIRQRKIRQALMTFSKEYIDQVESALGYPPTRADVILFFIERGGAENFARAHG